MNNMIDRAIRKGRLVYIMSDPHYNHKNILKHSSRGDLFPTVEDMNRTIIERINDTVPAHALLVLLGDMVFGSISGFVSQINADVILIKGNHDPRKSQAWYLSKGLVAYYDAPILVQKWFWLSHEPLEYMGYKVPYVNIHGHTHDECFASDQRVNVCWEILDGYPILLTDIIERYNTPEIQGYDDVRHGEEEGLQARETAINKNIEEV